MGHNGEKDLWLSDFLLTLGTVCSPVPLGPQKRIKGFIEVREVKTEKGVWNFAKVFPQRLGQAHPRNG